MATVRAVYEGGVFRPTGPVALPEGCEVEIELRAAEGAAPPASPPMYGGRHEPGESTPEGLAAIYEVLSRRYDSGETDVAERHNEHQP